MRLHIHSDLHLEGHNVPLDKSDANILVLAGDITVGMRHMTWVKNHAERYEHVIYVPGNHEYYGQSMEELDLAWRNCGIDNLFYMKRGYASIGGIRFIGATLWTDFRDDAIAEHEARACIRDFGTHHGTGLDMIRTGTLGAYRKFTPFAAKEQYKTDVAFIREFAEPGCVVITHFPPLAECRNMDFPEDLLAKYFCPDNPQLVHDSQAQLWISGHTHYNHHFKLGNTLMVSNQKGYGHEVHNYDPSFTVELQRSIDAPSESGVHDGVRPLL